MKNNFSQFLQFCHHTYFLMTAVINQTMNLGKVSKLMSQNFESSTIQDDFHKLMDICSSYGLNEEETNQLVDQFKRGAHFSPGPSYDDSLNQSLAEPEELQEEQYSFKHQKMPYQEDYSQRQQQEIKQEMTNRITDRNTDRASNHSRSQYKDEQNHLFEHLEKILTEKFAIEKGLIKNLQEENERLRSETQEKDRQIIKLAGMKGQDTQIIIGLKDIISNLTITLKEKESSYKELQDRYNNLMETRVKELSSRRSQTDLSEPELQEITSAYQNSMRDSSCHRKSGKTLKEDERTGFEKNRNSRIDVKKYKEMIENLRNNC